MFRQYRKIESGEFFLIFADTSSGGKDYNACQFLSKKNIDIPLVFHRRGIANDMTNALLPVIERIYDITGVQPMVCYENNNGGIFELERLAQMNRLNKFKIYTQDTHGTLFNQDTNRIGWTTNTATRPRMLQDLKNAIDSKILRIYDSQTIDELYAFIVSRTGKPQAENNSHDDLVMSLAGAWQLYQECDSDQLIDDFDTIPDDTRLFAGGKY